MNLEKKCSSIADDCLVRIRGLRSLLDQIERSVKDEESLINDLGALQSVPTILDCRLATLGALRLMKKDNAR